MDQCTKIDLKKGQKAVENIYTVKDNLEEAKVVKDAKLPYAEEEDIMQSCT